MARTYVYGYAGQRYTRAQIEGFPNFYRLHPEIRRRIWALLDAAQDAGVDQGIGSCWRSRDRAQELYDLWRLGKRSAPAMPPDRTYHCEKQDGFCYAADLIASDGHRWMNANAHRYGLRHFANVNDEPWHVQPPELATACTAAFQGRALPAFPLPGETTEGDWFDMATKQELETIAQTAASRQIWWLLGYSLNEDGSVTGGPDGHGPQLLRAAVAPAIDAEVNQAVRWAVQNEDGSDGVLTTVVRQEVAAAVKEIKDALGNA
jgi:hypothetical protein